MKQNTKRGNILEIGLDTIEIDIKTNREINENIHEFYSDKTGNLIGTMKRKQGKERGYRLNINLPKCVNKTNFHPFTGLDGDSLLEITKMITEEMKKLFGEEYPELIVSTCEVNTTVQFKKKDILEPMLNMFAHMFLAQDEKICIWVHGKKVGKRYEKLASLQSGMQIESIKTQILSNGRMSMKIYNKSLEQEIEDKGILRIETIYNRAGLNFAKAGRTLQDFLTVKSLKKIIELYRTDYKKYFTDRYWMNGGHPFYKDCINLIYNDLKKYKKPEYVALLNRNIVEWDFKFFEKACRKYYSKKNSANKACNRVKKSKELEIREYMVDNFVEISRIIIGIQRDSFVPV